MPRWRNWYTRMLEVHMPQGLEVRVLSWAPNKKHPTKSWVFFVGYSSANVLVVIHAFA